MALKSTFQKEIFQIPGLVINSYKDQPAVIYTNGRNIRIGTWNLIYDKTTGKMIFSMTFSKYASAFTEIQGFKKGVGKFDSKSSGSEIIVLGEKTGTLTIEESKEIIKNVFNGAECYAICEKGSNIAIGAVELKLNGHTDMTERDDECELGYWLGQPFWGRGYMPEAARALLRHGFEDLGMTTIWCGYYDGNQKSKRVQEKLGFLFHHTCNEVPVPLLNEIRVGHTNIMSKERWEELYK